MGRKTERRHTQGEESRRRILEATLAIAARRGYDGTTVAQVTEATGLPASSIYWHFGSKDELLADVLEHSFQQRTAMPIWSVDPGDEPRREQLENRMRQAIISLATQPEYWRLGLMLALERRPREPAARRRFLQMRAEAEHHIDGWWRQMLGPERLPSDVDVPLLMAQFTLAGLDGLFVAWQSDPDLGAAADRLARVLAHGLDAIAGHLLAGARPRSEAPAPAPAPAQEEEEAAGSGRDRILLSAAAVAAERGYDGATISRICARARLPASSLYWFYRDKDDLLAAVVEHSYREWQSRQPGWQPVPPGATWQDALRSRLTSSIESLAASPNFLRIGHMLALERRETPPSGRDLFLQVRRHARGLSGGWFADVLAADLPARDPDLPPLLSQLLMAFTDGLFLAHQMGTPEWDAELAGAMLVVLLEEAVHDHPRPSTTSSSHGTREPNTSIAPA